LELSSSVNLYFLIGLPFVGDIPKMRPRMDGARTIHQLAYQYFFGDEGVMGRSIMIVSIQVLVT
jgi:hypothetical protein